MTINFDNALGIHPQALLLRERRSEVLASNLANADTPDFKARDLDFKSVLNQAKTASVALERTSQGHQMPCNTILGAEMKYRNPHKASLDGNTVEAHVEQAKFAENAVQYQASLSFINGDFASLRAAIKGE